MAGWPVGRFAILRVLGEGSHSQVSESGAQQKKTEEDATLSVVTTGAEFPMAELSLKAEAAGMVASALKGVLR